MSNPLNQHNQPNYSRVDPNASSGGAPPGARPSKDSTQQQAAMPTEALIHGATSPQGQGQGQQPQLDEAEKARREKLAVYNQQGKVMAHAESEQEADFLREVVFQSQKHGKDIEAALEYLSDLLRKKTVECEGLRTLAQENYDPVRRAVRREYEARVQAEARQSTTLRTLQKRVEDLQAERQTLQQEVSSLKTLVSELERQPPPSNYDEFNGSLFNRVIYEDDDLSVNKGQSAAASASNAKENDNPANSWSVGQGGSILNTPKHQNQRDVLSGLSGIDTEAAKSLESAQVFDFIKALMVRMCSKLPNGAFPDLTTVITSLLRERRNDPNSLLRVGAQPIPIAEVSDRQRVTQIFLANNPGQLQALEMLLAQYHGREGELYEQLRDKFYTDDGKETVASNIASSPAVISSTSDARTPQAVSTDPATELHARIMLMYKKYNPAKLAGKDLNSLLSRYPPELLLAALVEKYGPEPSAAEKRELLRSLVEPTAA